MGFAIEGADGGTANVEGGRLYVVNQTPYEAAVERGDAYAWSWSFNAGANDTYLAVKNDSQDQVLVIDRIIISSDLADEVIVHTCDICTTGTAITGTNMNQESGKAAPATAKEDETANTLANGKLIIEAAVAADQTLVLDNLNIRLGYTQSIGVDCIAGSTALADGAIIGYFE
uniref:Uncharacterized protein n=1 Tax=viral metagenome TaxID=1070528 RepID=A0A6M3IHS5_9ZZZZ